MSQFAVYAMEARKMTMEIPVKIISPFVAGDVHSGNLKIARRRQDAEDIMAARASYAP